MPIDPQSPFDPNDPAQWARIRALPHIVIHPKPPPDAPPPDDGIDDWFAPWQPSDGPNDWIAPDPLSADGHPNDWIAPPPAALGTGQLPLSAAPPSAANSPSPYPAVPPDPFAAYWSTIPASRVGAMAWDPPNLPLFPPSSTNNFRAPASPFRPPTPPASWPPTLGPATPPWSSPRSWPNQAIPKGGLLDALATLGTGWPAGEGGLLGGLRNLGTQSDSTPRLPQGGILDALATLGTLPSAAPTWPQGGLSPSPGSDRLFSSPQPPQSANALVASSIERGSISGYSSGEIAGDGAKSLGLGLGQGLIQLAGLPGDVREMLARGTQRVVDYLAPDFATNAGDALSKALASSFPSWSGPTSAQLQSAAESITGPFYQPKTVVGDFAQTAGEFLPGALLMPAGGLARSALRYGVLPALSSEIAGQLTKGTVAEPWARAAGAILGTVGSPRRGLPLARRVPEIAEGEGGVGGASSDPLGRSPVENNAADGLPHGEKLRAKRAAQLAENRAAGRAWEEAVDAELDREVLDVAPQLTVILPSGDRIRLDFVIRNRITGEISCLEAKSSMAAPVSPRQAKGFKEIEQHGAIIVGEGKPGFPGGMKLPPTQVEIRRPRR